MLMAKNNGERGVVRIHRKIEVRAERIIEHSLFITVILSSIVVIKLQLILWYFYRNNFIICDFMLLVFNILFGLISQYLPF